MASKSATDGYIYIPVKRRQPIPAGQRAVMRVNSDAYNAWWTSTTRAPCRWHRSRPCSSATRQSECGW